MDWHDAVGLPTCVLNDGHAALLGEVWQGAARGFDNVLMLTLGTGVGGGALVDGRLLRGHRGRAGHFGHLSINPDGPRDIVGTPGSLEDAIGECTIAARSAGRFKTTRDLLAAMREGDVSARELWTRSVHVLAVALAGLVNALDPKIVVIGGGISGAGDDLFGPLSTEFAEMEWQIDADRVAIVPATLGSRAGAYGAAFRARKTFFSL
jgi:glucokinase